MPLVAVSSCAPLSLAPEFRLALERRAWLIGTGNWQIYWASVAQLDRASDFGSEGCRFESCPTRQIINGLQKPPFSTTLRVVPFVCPPRLEKHSEIRLSLPQRT